MVVSGRHAFSFSGQANLLQIQMEAQWKLGLRKATSGLQRRIPRQEVLLGESHVSFKQTVPAVEMYLNTAESKRFNLISVLFFSPHVSQLSTDSLPVLLRPALNFKLHQVFHLCSLSEVEEGG